MATSNNNVVVSRIQNRRGLKQDLPQPLRSGEIGLATDSRQVYIGGDESVSSTNKTIIYENTDNAKAIVDSIANNQIISFTVPHRRFNTSLDGLDGVAKSFTYTGSSDVSITDSSRDVFRQTVGAGQLVNILSNVSFDADDITVMKNGKQLIPAPNSSVTISELTSQDYIFTAGTSLGSDHTITFKTVPLTTDDIGITYYSNSAVITSLDGPGTSSEFVRPQGNASLGVTNFYAAQSIPTFLQIPTDLIMVNATTGTGYIGLQHKHTAVMATSTSDVSILTLGSLLVSRTSEKVTNSTFTASGNTITVAYADADQKYTTTANNFNRVYIENSTGNDADGNAVITGANATHFTFDVSSYGGAASGNLDHTRILQFDLSGVPTGSGVTTALSTASGIVNNTGNITTGSTITPSWHSLQLLPKYSSETGVAEDSTKVYFTHKSAQSSTPLDFTLHEDEANGTLSKLHLTDKSYTKDDTIKAKLEVFLYDVMINPTLNLFESIDTNQEYTSNTTVKASIGDYSLNTNTEGTEITFNSNEEARNFSTLVNKLYFEYSTYNTPGDGGLGSLSVNSRGLTNVKNNIQLQTAEGAASGLPDVGYDTTETASIPKEANTNIKTFDMTTYDTFVIDYSLDFRSGSDLYRKVGILQLSSYDYGSGNPADVIIQDYGTDKAVGVTGNVQFTANVSSSVLTLTAVSSVNQPCNMKYLVRKWNAPLT